MSIEDKSRSENEPPSRTIIELEQFFNITSAEITESGEVLFFLQTGESRMLGTAAIQITPDPNPKLQFNPNDTRFRLTGLLNLNMGVKAHQKRLPFLRVVDTNTSLLKTCPVVTRSIGEFGRRRNSDTLYYDKWRKYQSEASLLSPLLSTTPELLRLNTIHTIAPTNPYNISEHDLDNLFFQFSVNDTELDNQALESLLPY